MLNNKRCSVNQWHQRSKQLAYSMPKHKLTFTEIKIDAIFVNWKSLTSTQKAVHETLLGLVVQVSSKNNHVWDANFE